jgi:hypothetical protein
LKVWQISRPMAAQSGVEEIVKVSPLRDNTDTCVTFLHGLDPLQTGQAFDLYH